MQTIRLIGYGSSLGERLTGYENLYSSQPYFYPIIAPQVNWSQGNKTYYSGYAQRSDMQEVLLKEIAQSSISTWTQCMDHFVNASSQWEDATM